MSTIIINEIISTKGELVVSNSIAVNEEGKKFILTQGTLKIDALIDEIDMIESDRLKVSGVYVFEEVFSSEEDNILYKFQAESLERSEN